MDREQPASNVKRATVWSARRASSTLPVTMVGLPQGLGIEGVVYFAVYFVIVEHTVNGHET